jgi:hemolysin activation/secretion protein
MSMVINSGKGKFNLGDYMKYSGLVPIFWPAVLILAVCSLQAPALLAVDETGSSQAGSLEQALKEREEEAREGLEAESPEIESKVVAPQAPEVSDSPFQVVKVNFVGNTVVSSEELGKIASQYENRSGSLRSLQGLAQEVTTFYRDRGYVTSWAVVPSQSVSDGTVRVEIHEGTVESIQITGQKWSDESLIRRRFKVKEGGVLRYQDLARGAAVLNINPDRRVRVQLLPGTEAGKANVRINVEEHFPFHASYGFHDLGTPATGRLRQQVSAGKTNLLGMDDQLFTLFEVSERSDLVGTSTSYTTPVNQRGDMFAFDVRTVNVELGEPFKSFDAKGRAVVFGPTFLIPFVMSKFVSGEWALGFDYKRVRSTVGGNVTAKDDLRVFRLGPNFIESDRYGKAMWLNEVQFGFSGFLGGLRHNDIAASREKIDGNFIQYNLGLGRLQNLWNGTHVIASGQWQYSPHRLVPSQQFRLGGYNTVRGYPEGDYLGDAGYQGTIELRVPPYFIPESVNWPFAETSVRKTLLGVVFIDHAYGYLNSEKLEEEKNQALTGLGFGVRVNISQNFQAYVLAGFPVGPDPSDGDQADLHFAIRTGF